jgi:hypothetical protein
MEAAKHASLHVRSEHFSPLLAKTRRLGLTQARDLERLAVIRGLRYYDGHGDSLKENPTSALIAESGSEQGLTDEELAIALLAAAAPYSQLRIRMGAAMLAAAGNLPESLADLALQERCEPVVRYIAQCGHEVEPANSFWDKLLELLPSGNSSPLPSQLPHPTRFVAMTGITRTGVCTIKQWIRPHVHQSA